MENNPSTYRYIKIWTTFCRFLLAGVFIFSGFVKAVDPWGTFYKIQDYLIAMGIPGGIPDLFLFLASVFLACLEFCLGAYLFFGIRRRITPRLVLLMMSVMTPLTLWLAVANPISDCGCFGDAIQMTNWETFGKNVLLLVAAVSVYKWRKSIFPLVTIRFDWLIALYSWIYIFGIIIYSYWNLPIFDFRPYHVGADIRQGMVIPDGETPPVFETRFVMQKNGVKKEFTIENYPDSTWTFVDSYMIVKEKGYEPPIHDFSIVKVNDGEDITDQVLQDANYTFLLVAHQLDKADESCIDLISELYDYSIENNYGFYCLTSTSDDDIEGWCERTGAEYPFAIMDNITLKTIIRSNPGLILLKEGKVVNKWSVNNIPDEYQLVDRLENLPIGYATVQPLLNKIILTFLWFFIPLMFVCLLDMAWERYNNRKKLRKKEN